jgi:hypothetical protein
MTLHRRSVGKALIVFGVTLFCINFLVSLWIVAPTVSVLVFSVMLIALGNLVLEG